MSYEVAVAFRTPLRRFAQGDTVTPDDIDGPMAFGDWVFEGFIVASYTTLTSTISSGNSVSSDIPLAFKTPISIAMPAAWDAAVLTFQASVDDGANWFELHTDIDSPIVANVSSGAIIRLRPAEWTGISWLRIRSGRVGTPVTQTADRVLTITASNP